jgi:hypothetical protein
MATRITSSILPGAAATSTTAKRSPLGPTATTRDRLHRSCWKSVLTLDMVISIVASGAMMLLILLGGESIEGMAPLTPPDSRDAVVENESVSLRLELMKRYESP